MSYLMGENMVDVFFFLCILYISLDMFSSFVF